MDYVDRAGLVPLIEVVEQTVTFTNFTEPGNAEHGRDLDNKQEASVSGMCPPLTVDAATRTLEMALNRTQQRRGHVPLQPYDPGVAWLLANGLAEHDTEHDDVILTEWLDEALYRRTRDRADPADRLERRFI